MLNKTEILKRALVMWSRSATQGNSNNNVQKNGLEILLYFLIHIDVLMLCRKFEVISTSIFQVTAILRNGPKSENFPVL